MQQTGVPLSTDAKPAIEKLYRALAEGAEEFSVPSVAGSDRVEFSPEAPFCGFRGKSPANPG